MSTVGLNEATIKEYIQDQGKADILQDKISMIANGVDQKIAQAHLWHKDSTTTHKYCKFSIRYKGYIKGVINEKNLLIKANTL